jgi:hypothetical protein
MCAAAADHLDKLCNKIGKRWAAIDQAGNDAATEIERIGVRLTTPRELVPSDTSFVVFGSLARGEWTVGSDVDWTLLIDGQSDPDHFKVSQEIKGRFVETGWNAPGVTEIFGNLAFSHEIIHQIGGGGDTNRNTTQRILLLLESRVSCFSRNWRIAPSALFL